MTRLRSALALVDQSRVLVAATIGVAALQTLCLLPVALIVRRIFDHEIPADDTTGILVSGGLALGCYALSAALAVVSRSILIDATKRAIVGLRGRVMDKLYVLPRAWFDRQPAGAVHARLVQDTEMVDLMLNLLLTQLGPATIVSLALCGVGLYLNPVLFAALMGVVVVMLTVRRWTRRHYRARVERFSDAMAAFSADGHEALASLEATRVHGVARWQRARRAAAIERLAGAGRDFVRTASIDSAVQASLAASSGVVVLVVGGILVAHGSMSLGALLGFYAVVALLLRQIGPVVGGTATVMSGHAALERINRFLALAPDDACAGVRPPAFDGGLRVEDASFWYGDERVLDGVDLVVEPSEHVAIMGPNGSGKSTLVALILGVRRPHSGRVLAGGVPLDDLDLAALRRRIGVVLQEPVLIRGTIAENIAWGRADPGGPEVRAAAERATAAEFIERLPDGYDTMLGEDGAGLSGGERQRIAIARALVGDPVLLLLDEPSNHLDQTSIDAVLEGLGRLPGNPAVVTVTHDAQVAARADRIVTLRDGRVVEDVATA